MRNITILILLALPLKLISLQTLQVKDIHIRIIPFEWFYNICFLESSHRKEVGLSQIKAAAIKDINRAYNTSYGLEDDKDYKKAFEMFCKYINLYNKEVNLKSVVKTWRYGPFSRCNFLHRGYYIKLNKLLNNFYMSSKSIKPSREDLKSLKVGKTFKINKSVVVTRLTGGFLLKTKSGHGIFQCSSSKSMVEYLKSMDNV